MGEPSNAEIHDSYVAALRHVARASPGGAWTELPSWLLWDAGVGNDAFNIAIPRASLRDPAAALDEAEEWFAARDCDFRLSLRDDADAAVAAAARGRGFSDWWSEPVMLLHPLSAVFVANAPGASIVRVMSEAHLELYGDVEPATVGGAEREVARGVMATPGCSLWVATVKGEPVARAVAIASGRLVRVNNVFVAPAWRRQGLGTAVTAAAVDGGRGAGTEAACLAASEMGEPLYRSMGFLTRYRQLSLHAPARLRR
ncbi:MAG: GNAT family N-acetyltransferase [Chloroflexi bacterium]|nr:GNAT family N-acetyltransferase [Chloroflexota bacterium]